MAVKEKRARYKNCPVCSAGFVNMDALYEHFEKEHCSQKPADMSVQQYYYFMRTGKLHGTCIVCGKDTEWNNTTNKYHRFCNNPKCKEEYRKIFEKRMIGKYGKVNLLNDPDQQRKMLAGRSISGKYKWSDGSYKTYTGSYEKDFLQMLDVLMNFDSDDVMTPSPHTYYYVYGGEKKMYIPDIYIPSLNLEIEIKTNENKHHKIQEVDKVKEKLKDDVLKSIKTVNYIKIVDKKYDGFFEYLVELKESFKELNPVSMNKPVKEAYDDVDLWMDEEINEIVSLEESSVHSQNIYEEYKIPDHEISLSDGVYDDNGIWNSYILHKGKRYRYRVETIVFNEKNQIFAHLKGTECRLPGGSTEKDTDPMVQAECEVNEEARFRIKNLRDSGVSYRKMLSGHRPKYMSKLPWSYDAYYTKIYVAEYDGPYRQFVAEKDRDTNMYINGRFYDYKEVLDKFNDSQRKVAIQYLSNKMDGEVVTEGFIDMPNDVYLDYDRFVNGQTNILFITGLPYAYNEKVAEKICNDFDNTQIINVDTDSRINVLTLKELIRTAPGNRRLIIVGHKLAYNKSFESIIRNYPVIITHFPMGRELVEISHEQMNYLGLRPNQYGHWIKHSKDRLLELHDSLADYKAKNTKAKASNKTNPVFVLLMHSGTLLSNTIKKVTGNEFSHSSISFDSSMNSMFSFGRKFESNPFVAGLVREDIDKAFFKRPIPYALYVTFVDDDEYAMMKSNLFNMIKRGDELSYNIEGLVKYVAGMNPETKDKLFCSEFVATILNSKTKKSDLRPAMTKPTDLAGYDNMYFVTSGILTEYDKNKVDKIVAGLKAKK